MNPVGDVEPVACRTVAPSRQRAATASIRSRSRPVMHQQSRPAPRYSVAKARRPMPPEAAVIQDRAGAAQWLWPGWWRGRRSEPPCARAGRAAIRPATEPCPANDPGSPAVSAPRPPAARGPRPTPSRRDRGRRAAGPVAQHDPCPRRGTAAGHALALGARQRQRQAVGRPPPRIAAGSTAGPSVHQARRRPGQAPATRR